MPTPMSTSTLDLLPLVIAGPILRHCDTRHFTLWFVSSTPLSELSLRLQGADFSRQLTNDEVHTVKLGKHAYQYLVNVAEDALLPANTSP